MIKSSICIIWSVILICIKNWVCHLDILFSIWHFPDKMDQVMQLVDPAKQFAKDSIRLVKRCTKPDRKGNVN